jgi:hypothetical protein
LRGHVRGVSEYRTPEEDTIGRRPEADDDRDQSGPPPESGEKPAGTPRREGQAAEDKAS